MGPCVLVGICERIVVVIQVIILRNECDIIGKEELEAMPARGNLIPKTDNGVRIISRMMRQGLVIIYNNC